MGKNHTVYFHDDVEAYIQNSPNLSIGKIVNDAIRREFNQDEDTLRRKMEIIDKELNLVKIQLQQCVELRLKNQTAKEQQYEVNEEAVKQAKFFEDLKIKWQKGEISDDEYWKHFN